MVLTEVESRALVRLARWPTSSPSARSATTRRVAGPLETLVAPPYDVISAEQREELPRAEPAQRRPPDPARLRGGGGARAARTWRDEGVLVEERRPSGRSRRTTSARTASRARATALVASLQGRAVRDRHGAAARAHARRPEGGPAAPAARDARQLEPIFLLYDGAAPLEPARPRAGSRGRRREALAARRPDASSAYFADQQLLIADGHHRYETALAFAEEEGHAGERADARRARLDRATRGSRSSPPTGSSRTSSTPTCEGDAESRGRELGAAESSTARRRIAAVDPGPASRASSTSSSSTALGHEGLAYTADRGRGAARGRRGRGRRRLPAAADADRGRLRRTRAAAR